jgi:hypothetical protein
VSSTPKRKAAQAGNARQQISRYSFFIAIELCGNRIYVGKFYVDGLLSVDCVLIDCVSMGCCRYRVSSPNRYMFVCC